MVSNQVDFTSVLNIIILNHLNVDERISRRFNHIVDYLVCMEMGIRIIVVKGVFDVIDYILILDIWFDFVLVNNKDKMDGNLN